MNPLVSTESEKEKEKDILDTLDTKEKKDKYKDECVELKNIKYKTMLNGHVLTCFKTSQEDLTKLDKFLDDDKIHNISEPWSKLDKTIKTQKILLFAKEYGKIHHFNDEEINSLIAFLKECLGRKRIQRVRDVIYDKTIGKIMEIPALTYNKGNKHFTLKNLDKRINTLKSLAPMKKQKTHVTTVKNKESVSSSSSTTSTSFHKISNSDYNDIHGNVIINVEEKNKFNKKETEMETENETEEEEEEEKNNDTEKVDIMNIDNQQQNLSCIPPSIQMNLEEEEKRNCVKVVEIEKEKDQQKQNEINESTLKKKKRKSLATEDGNHKKTKKNSSLLCEISS